jgi:2,3-dihydroxybiphenyl 1,2-dioxygenase
MGLSGVAGLEYIELGVSDLAAWRDFAEGVLGLACEQADGALLARMDAQPWRIRILESGEDDVRALGFRVSDAAALEAIRMRLAGLGSPLEPAGAADAGMRGVQSLWYCADPDELRIELFVGERSQGEPFRSPLGVGGFVTNDQGFGHAVLMVSDRERADAFFQQGLGMRVSDYILLGPPGRQITLTFLHCNARHHTLAYVPVAAPKRLNHIMLQTVDMDDVGRALDRAVSGGLTISSSLGRHTNDRMTSFYVRTPSGFDVEYGWGGIEVDDASWTVTSYEATSIWGHKRPAAAG